MASRQELENALIAAHEAGDIEAAELFASEIKGLTAQSPPADPALYNKPDGFGAAALRYGRDAARAVGLAGRTVMNAVTSIPLAAMDAGIAARNAIEGRIPWTPWDATDPNAGAPYQSASGMWNESMNSAGVPQFQGPIEKGGDIVGQMLLGSKMQAPGIANPAPAGFNPALSPVMTKGNKVVPNQNASRALAFSKARTDGYVVPPSTVNPSTTNKVLESIGGKVALEQDASIRGQSVTDALMKRSVGLDDATQMSEDVLPALRSTAAGKYRALRSVGTMRADAEYGKALDAITAQYRGAAKDFPDLARDDIVQAVESVRKPSFDANSAMDAIAILRDKASTAYGQGDKALGKAYREISGAMESAIERSLARRGKDSAKLLNEFRDARQLIAKSYTAEGALNSQVGSFNAAKLSTQLAKGKPLSGEAKKVAEFATAFPKAAKLVLDSGPVRNTDVILGAGTAAMAREPTYLLYPFARQAVRAGLLSEAGQRILTQPGMQPMPQTALGIAYGTQGLLGQ